jgi:hypothetical protein
LSKSRRRPVRRATKKTPSRRKATRKAVPARQPKVVRLKPLYSQLARTIEQLEKLPPSDRVKFAIERLAQCRAEFADICGPTMDIPVSALSGA